MSKKTTPPPVEVDTKRELREARKELVKSLKEQCKTKSFQSDAAVSKAQQKMERLKRQRAHEVADKRIQTGTAKIKEKYGCR
jgi:ribosome recycling factor